VDCCPPKREKRKRRRKKRNGKMKGKRDMWKVVSGLGDFLLFKTPYYY
jgi:hypothetical protein